MGLSFGELVIIAFAALVFIGPKDMPRVMREIGGAIRKIRNMSEGFLTSLEKEIEQPKKYIKDLNGNLQETFTLDDFIDSTSVKITGDKK